MKRLTPKLLKKRFPGYNAWKFGDHSIYGFSSGTNNWLVIIGGMKIGESWPCISYSNVSNLTAGRLLFGGDLIPSKDEYLTEYKFTVTEDEFSSNEFLEVEDIIGGIKRLEDSEKAELYRKLAEML